MLKLCVAEAEAVGQGQVVAARWPLAKCVHHCAYVHVGNNSSSFIFGSGFVQSVACRFLGLSDDCLRDPEGADTVSVWHVRRKQINNE